MFTLIKTAAASSFSRFIKDIAGATALIIILFVGLHMPAML